MWLGAVMLALQLSFNALDVLFGTFDGLLGMLPGSFFWSFFVLLGAGDIAMRVSRRKLAVLLRSAALVSAAASLVLGAARGYWEGQTLLLLVDLGIRLAVFFVVLSVMPGRRGARG